MVLFDFFDILKYCSVVKGWGWGGGGGRALCSSVDRALDLGV